LTFFPYVLDFHLDRYLFKFASLRGFLVVFDLAQIINLLWLSFKTRCVGLNLLSFTLTDIDQYLWTHSSRYSRMDSTS
jgi:hypothetical protein